MCGDDHTFRLKNSTNAFWVSVALFAESLCFLRDGSDCIAAGVE